MKILIAPLNWGLGHATRCIPLIRQYLHAGDEVVIAGDGDSLSLLRKHFPNLRSIDFPSLALRYTPNNAQRGFYLRAIPTLVRHAIGNRYYLHKLLAIEHFDLVISDNRFGLFSRQTHCVYITHQLYIILPKRLRWLQPLARAIHACIYKRYDEVWVPDYADASHNLSGELAHGGRFDHKVKYIGPLSRFSNLSANTVPAKTATSNYDSVAILSGLEPQRTMFEKTLIEHATKTGEKMLLVQGLVNRPPTHIQRGNITIVPYLSDNELVHHMQKTTTIIARSGYSTIMDLDILGLLNKAKLHPTPGQSEQEYLASHLST
jgi:hypothetical protein